jgi:hypothetical protein
MPRPKKIVTSIPPAKNLNDFSGGIDALELRVFDEAELFRVAASYGGGRRASWEFDNPADAYKKRDEEARSVVYAIAGLRSIVLDGRDRDKWLARYELNRLSK